MDVDKESPKSYTGIYSMHKYWSKKPYNVISKYIESYSEKGDIVLDPFSGSGISSIESVFLNRRTMGIDINPMSIFITRQMLSNIDINAIEKEFLNLEKKVHEKINKLYKIFINDNSFTATHFLYSGDTLTEIWYKDGKVKKIVDMAKAKNLILPKNITYKNIKTFIPKSKMIKNSRINAKDSMSIHDLFTPRNTLALSLLLSEINKIKNKELREYFRFCFTACSGQASKMVFIINNRKNTISKRKEVGSWVIGYWLPKAHFEINAWNCFENRYKKILKSKKKYAKLNPNVIYAKNFEELKKKGNICLLNASCYGVLKKLPDCSIDYIITDPPHGNRLPYLELSMMWNDWLGFNVNMKDELIVSDAKTRNKTVSGYIKLLDKILAETTRVLKNGKYFTLMFNSYDNKTWTGLQKILHNLDLELYDVNTIGYSALSVIQDNRKGGLKTDFVFTFQKKHSKNKQQWVADEKTINSLISKYLKKNKDHSLYLILNYVIINLVRNKLIFDMDSVISLISANNSLYNRI